MEFLWFGFAVLGRLWLATFLVTLPAHAASTNRTIDDQNGDSVTGKLPVYSPSDAWQFGPDCPGCFVQPDPLRVRGGSWHDTTAHKDKPESLSLSFTGTAIYIFCVVPNHVEWATTTVYLTFTVDGQDAGSYLHAPDASSTTYLYDVPVFSRAGLSNNEHEVIVTPVGTETSDSLMLFDYALYTFEDAPAPPPPPPVTTTATTTKISTAISTAIETKIPDTSTTTSTTSTSTTTSTSSIGVTTSTTSPAPIATGGTSLTIKSSDSSTERVGTNVPSTPTTSSRPGDRTNGASSGVANGTKLADTTPSPTEPAQPRQSLVAPIAGGAVGGVVVIALLVLAFICCRRRKHRSNTDFDEKAAYNHPAVHEDYHERAVTPAAATGLAPNRFDSYMKDGDDGSELPYTAYTNASSSRMSPQMTQGRADMYISSGMAPPSRRFDDGRPSMDSQVYGGPQSQVGTASPISDPFSAPPSSAVPSATSDPYMHESSSPSSSRMNESLRPLPYTPPPPPMIGGSERAMASPSPTHMPTQAQAPIPEAILMSRVEELEAEVGRLRARDTRSTFTSIADAPPAYQSEGTVRSNSIRSNVTRSSGRPDAAMTPLRMAAVPEKTRRLDAGY